MNNSNKIIFFKLFHSIGLIFASSQDINSFYNLKYEKNYINLNYLHLLIKNDQKNTFPVIKLDTTLIKNSNFKFKKFIRQYLKNNFKLKKKYIVSIKSIPNEDKYIHNYLILLTKKTKKLLKFNFNWISKLDFFKYDEKENISKYSISKYAIFKNILKFKEKNNQNNKYILYSDAKYNHSEISYIDILKKINEIYYEQQVEAETL